MRHVRPEDIRHGLLNVLKVTCPRIRVESWSPLAQPLFEYLWNLGRRCGYEAWYSKGGRAYLWDIAWVSPSKAPRYWLELVGEIELSDPGLREVLDDFYKVFDAKARLKVFVCSTLTSNGKCPA